MRLKGGVEYPKFVDDEDMKLWLKELVLAGRSVTIRWRPLGYDKDGYALYVESLHNDPDQLDKSAQVEVWADKPIEGKLCGSHWSVIYRYGERYGKAGWWSDLS